MDVAAQAAQRVDEETRHALGIGDQLVAQRQAVIGIGRVVRREAFVMSCSDMFLGTASAW